MKKIISVILPVNNPEMLSQHDLAPYQSDDFYFKLSYINTHLKEITSAAEGAQAFQLVLDEIKKAEKDGASAVIVFAFGDDLAIKEGRELVSIPVMSLGIIATHLASLLCRHHFTIIPPHLDHNSFFQALVDKENLNPYFVPAKHAPGVNPIEIRSNPLAFEKLVNAISAEIQENDVDTFTLGCGSFIGIAKPLEAALRKKTKKPFIIIDPITVTFNTIKTLL